MCDLIVRIRKDSRDTDPKSVLVRGTCRSQIPLWIDRIEQEYGVLVDWVIPV
jgi:hypothetical protein